MLASLGLVLIACACHKILENIGETGSLKTAETETVTRQHPKTVISCSLTSFRETFGNL